MSESQHNTDYGDAPPFAELRTRGRNADGTAGVGNLLALKDGRRSKQIQAGELPEQADAKAALAEHEAAIVADLGGDEVVGVLARDAVSRYVTLQLVEDWLSRN